MTTRHAYVIINVIIMTIIVHMNLVTECYDDYWTIRRQTKSWSVKDL